MHTPILFLHEGQHATPPIHSPVSIGGGALRQSTRGRALPALQSSRDFFRGDVNPCYYLLSLHAGSCVSARTSTLTLSPRLRAMMRPMLRESRMSRCGQGDSKFGDVHTEVGGQPLLHLDG